MAVTVTQCGTATFSRNPLASGSSLRPKATSLQCPVTNTSGDWMVALIAWMPFVPSQSQSTTPSVVTFSVADDAHNWWEPLGVPGCTSPAGFVQTSIWVAPAATAATNVMIAPTGNYNDVAVFIFDVSGLLPWYTINDFTSGLVLHGTSLSRTIAAPASQELAFTVGASTSSVTLTGPGGTWTAGPTATTTNGLSIFTGYQVTTHSATATWSTSGGVTTNIAMSVGGFLVSGTPLTQVNSNWPVTVMEIAPGFGAQTPPDQLFWANITSRYLSLDVTQGRQYQLDTLQAANGSIMLDNPDGALVPPGSGTFANGIDSGLPVRLRTYWAGGAWQMQFSGDGVTASPQASTGNIFTVVPGQTYSVGAWLACSVPYASGVQIEIRWRTSGGTLISSSISSPVTGTAAVASVASGIAPATAALANVVIRAPGTPPSATVFTAAALTPAPSGALIIPSGITWVAQNNATVTALASWTPDRRGAPNNTPWSVPFAGFVQQWPQTWDANTLRGSTTVTITDAFGYLTSNLIPILNQEVLLDNPGWYWPCIDPATSQAAVNYAPNGNQTPLVITGSKYGTGGATATFGQNGSGLLGAQGSIPITSTVRVASQSGMWGQTIPASTFSAINGLCLEVTDEFPAPSFNGMSIEFWFMLQSPQPANYQPTIMSFGRQSQSNGNDFIMGTSTPTGQLAVSGSNVTSPVIYSTANLWGLTTMNHVVVTMNTVSFTTFMNGNNLGNTLWNSTPRRFTQLAFGGSPMYYAGGVTAAMLAMPGFIAHCAVYTYQLDPVQIRNHYNAGILGMAGDTVSSRIERLLQSTPYLGRRAIIQDTGQGVTQMVSCQDISGQPASASLTSQTVSTVPGSLWNTPNGDLYYQARSTTWNQAAKWVVGNRPDLGEIPVQPGLAYGYDPLRVINNVQLTQLDNQDVIAPSGQVLTSIVPLSQAQYGSLSYAVTSYLQGDLFQPYSFGPSLFDLANWIGATNAKPLLRLTAVATDAARFAAGWPFVLSASPGDTVTVNYRPPTNTGELISVTGRISQIQRSLSFSPTGNVTGTVSFLVDPMPEQNVLVIGDPVRGQLNGTNLLAW